MPKRRELVPKVALRAIVDPRKFPRKYPAGVFGVYVDGLSAEVAVIRQLLRLTRGGQPLVTLTDDCPVTPPLSTKTVAVP